MQTETIESDVAETSDNQPSKLPGIPGKPFPFFTRENARQLQANAVAARKRNQAARESAKQVAEVKPPEPAQTPPPIPPQSGEYAVLQVARVRGHIERLDKLIDAATVKADAQAIERLMRARGIAEELERRASDRSLPPVKRVAEVKTGNRSSALSGIPD